MLCNKADARRCSYFELGLPVLPVNRFQADHRLRDRHLKAKVKGVSLSKPCHLIFFICFGLFSVRMLSLSSLLISESNCFAIFTVFPLFYLLFTFFSLPCFAFLFVCFYFGRLFSACFQACKVSKVATLMSSKLKVRKQIDCYGEEKKITTTKPPHIFHLKPSQKPSRVLVGGLSHPR